MSEHDTMTEDTTLRAELVAAARRYTDRELLNAQDTGELAVWVGCDGDDMLRATLAVHNLCERCHQSVHSYGPVSAVEERPAGVFAVTGTHRHQHDCGEWVSPHEVEVELDADRDALDEPGEYHAHAEALVADTVLRLRTEVLTLRAERDARRLHTMRTAAELVRTALPIAVRELAADPDADPDYRDVDLAERLHELTGVAVTCNDCGYDPGFDWIVDVDEYRDAVLAWGWATATTTGEMIEANA